MPVSDELGHRRWQVVFNLLDQLHKIHISSLESEYMIPYVN